MQGLSDPGRVAKGAVRLLVVRIVIRAHFRPPFTLSSSTASGMPHGASWATTEPVDPSAAGTPLNRIRALPESLAGRTEHRCPLLHTRSLQGHSTGMAWAAGSPIDAMQALETSPAPIGGAMVLDGASTKLDCLGQHRPNRPGEAVDRVGIEAVRPHARMHARAKERLVRVDVADAGDDRLVEQRRLDRPSGAAKTLRQFLGAHAQGIRPKPAPAALPDRAKVGMRLEPSESARVPVSQRANGTVGTGEHPMRVHMTLIRRGACRIDDAKRAAHAQMHEQASGRSLDHQLLAMPPDSLEAATRR